MMSGIPRYRMTNNLGESSRNGAWVKYEDHVTAMAFEHESYLDALNDIDIALADLRRQHYVRTVRVVQS